MLRGEIDHYWIFLFHEMKFRPLDQEADRNPSSLWSKSRSSSMAWSAIHWNDEIYKWLQASVKYVKWLIIFFQRIFVQQKMNRSMWRCRRTPTVTGRQKKVRSGAIQLNRKRESSSKKLHLLSGVFWRRQYGGNSGHFWCILSPPMNIPEYYLCFAGNISSSAPSFQYWDMAHQRH